MQGPRGVPVSFSTELTAPFNAFIATGQWPPGLNEIQSFNMCNDISENLPKFLRL